MRGGFRRSLSTLDGRSWHDRRFASETYCKTEYHSMPSEMNRVAASKLESRPWDFLLRARYQISAGILIAVLAPVYIRNLLTGAGIDQATQYNTAIGGCIALILGFLSYRRLHIFPGLASGGYIITAFSITFGLLAAVLFMLRLEYSRVQFLSSYLLSLAVFTYLHMRFEAQRTVRLGVIPNGATQNLPEFNRVIWYQIPSPEAELPPLIGVVADLNANHSDAWSSRIAAFALAGTPVYHIKQAIEQLSGRVEIDHLAENTLGALNPNDLYLKTKAFLDTIVAIVLLVILSPLLLVTAILIRCDSPGPALFRQRRTGFRAVPFTVFKFRTMYVEDTSAAADPRLTAVTKERDSRITRVGALLRRTRLDELPQLLNVLRGEMSLIGPRPEALALTRWYESEIPFYHYRHIIKPGLSGWAQVNQGHVSDVSDVREKLNLDFYYVKNFSFWLDLLITLRTIQIIFTGKGAK
jgi:lipopolysaccharide/colanic/teichoic acid biosynthesis glycosyltransferase